MRVAFTVCDDLGSRFLKEAQRRGQTLSQFLADAGQVALDSLSGSGLSLDFELVTFCGDGVIDGIDLDRTNDLFI